MAAYMLGFVLECALKAAVCKALHLVQYPGGGKGIENWFLTHDFDRLLVVSGTSDLFGIDSVNNSSWSGFVQEIAPPGVGPKWVDMRYEELSRFTEDRVKTMRAFLVNEGKTGILNLLDINERW